MTAAEVNKLTKKVKKFIGDNSLDFDGSGSDLNSVCCTVAGFICYMMDGVKGVHSDGIEIINEIPLSIEAYDELVRVYNFAYANNYKKFWTTQQAKD